MPPARGPSEPSRGPRAIVEENLPLGALNFERGPFLGRTRLGPGSLAERDERERIPFPARSKFSFRNPVQNLSRGPRELRERRMRDDLPEPVRSISRIQLLAMQNRMPQFALFCGRILRQAMRLFEA